MLQAPIQLWTLAPTFVERSQRLPPVQFQATGSKGEARCHGEAAGGQAAGDVPRREELVIQQLVNRWARGRVGPQHLLDEVSSHGVDVLRGDRQSLEAGSGDGAHQG